MNIDNLVELENSSTIEDFNDIPVEYCKKCLSLRIINYQGRVKGYCEECGNVETGLAHIEEWEKMYEKRYGKSFVPKSKLKF